MMGDIEITIKDVAKAFDMKVSELAKFLGYSRQNLYLIIDGNKKQSIRNEAAFRLLEMEHRRKTMSEQLQALRRRKQREEIINMLRGMR